MLHAFVAAGQARRVLRDASTPRILRWDVGTPDGTVALVVLPKRHGTDGTVALGAGALGSSAWGRTVLATGRTHVHRATGILLEDLEGLAEDALPVCLLFAHGDGVWGGWLDRFPDPVHVWPRTPTRDGTVLWDRDDLDRVG